MMKTYTVKFSDHDKGAKGGEFTRETKERAEFSKRLMHDCGYRTVTIEAE